ncbi:hypothetical protein QUC31_020138, partial [Theobroma cacao]
MAIASVAFKSREDHRKQLELEKTRKAGLASIEVDDDGKEISPHIPQCMSSVPWYLNVERPRLKHQRKWKSDPNYTKSWYDRGAKIIQANKYPKDVNSAYYDPKTRSMREDPLPDADHNEKFYGGDNQYRMSGQALEFKQLNIHAWEAFNKGQDIHMQAALSQAQLPFRNYKVIKEKLKSKTKDTIMEKHGNAATEEEIPMELLLGQINYCTGAAGIEAAEAATDLMKANIARKAVSEDVPPPAEEKKLATWGTDVPYDLVIDEKLLTEALKEEDERKRKYNIRWNDEVTAEDMEAYWMKKIHHDDPMKDFLNYCVILY